MNASEMVGKIGKMMYVRDGEVLYEAKILDVKSSYGADLYLVTPVAGCGKKWVKSYNGEVANMKGGV